MERWSKDSLDYEGKVMEHCKFCRTEKVLDNEFCLECGAGLLDQNEVDSLTKKDIDYALTTPRGEILVSAWLRTRPLYELSALDEFGECLLMFTSNGIIDDSSEVVSRVKVNGSNSYALFKLDENSVEYVVGEGSKFSPLPENFLSSDHLTFFQHRIINKFSPQFYRLSAAILAGSFGLLYSAFKLGSYLQ